MYEFKGPKAWTAKSMMNVFNGGPILALMLWEQLLKLLRPWLLCLLARMLFFHSANRPMIQKKLRENIECGDQVYKDDG